MVCAGKNRKRYLDGPGGKLVPIYIILGKSNFSEYCIFLSYFVKKYLATIPQKTQS